MKDYGKVRSTIKPESMIIDEYSVWVNENIKEIEVQNEVLNTENKSTTHTEYEYNVIQYDKDEFIIMQSQLITDTQIAMCEIYESLGV